LLRFARRSEQAAEGGGPVKFLEDENNDPGPRPVGESIEKVGRRLGAPGMVLLARLMARWDDVVGPAVANHVTPVAVHDDVLVVDVDQPIWRTQLGFLEADLVRQVREVTGLKIARIEARVRPV
jgi:predicted nucleic acid-binding Zn ribbon protein